jgi:hypothetical protein
LSAVAVTLNEEPAAPATRVSDVGDAASVKSGGAGETVAERVEEWLSAPEVPVRVNITLPAAEFAAAVIVTFCGVPGIRVSVAGWAVTPAGSPVIATFTAPVKLLDGTVFTLICCPAPPARSVTAPGVTVRVKSPSGAFEPPQESRMRQKRKLEHPTRAFEKTPMGNPQESVYSMYFKLFRARATWTDSTPRISHEL